MVSDFKRGDVVELGRHRLMCGDAFSAEDVGALMQGEKPDMLYCDPPYGMGLNADYERNAKWSGRSTGKVKSGGHKRGGNYAPVIGDDAPFDATPLIERFSRCREQFWWGADYYGNGLPDGGSWIVWDKRIDTAHDAMWGSCFELCWSRMPHRREIIRCRWVGFQGTQIEPGHRRFHPTQKPVALSEWFLSRYSKDNALIADLFAGAGSTLLAAERMERRAYVMEISPDYCGLIVERYRALVEKRRLPLFEGSVA